MTWNDAGPYIAAALSSLVLHWSSGGRARSTMEKVETESSKIQMGVVGTGTAVTSAIKEVIETKPIAQNIDYGSRLSSLERKQDLIISNLKRKPGTPWVDDVTTIPGSKD